MLIIGIGDIIGITNITLEYDMKEMLNVSVKDNAVLSVLGIETEIDNLGTEEIFRNLRRIKELSDVLKNHEKLLRDKAFETAEKVGEQDDKGSFFVRLPNGDWFKKEARTSIKIKTDEAVSLLAQKGLNDRLTPVLDDLDPRVVYNTIKEVNPAMVQGIKFTVDDSELEQAYYQGEISDEELQALVERTVTYALKLKPNKQ